MSKTIYISVDIESVGDVPGKFSLISLGAAAYNIYGTLLDTFMVNVQELEGAIQDPATMSFWALNRAAYEATLVDRKPAEEAMESFTQWFEKLENPVFVFCPSKFDAMFVYWYLQTFVDRMTFKTTPDMFDTKTLAAALLKVDNVREASKRNWPKRWKNKKLRHSHLALDDAIEQGQQFIKILREVLYGEEGSPSSPLAKFFTQEEINRPVK
jgi:hypothetical protein